MKIEESIQRIECSLLLIQSPEKKKKLQQKIYNLKLILILIEDVKELKRLLENENFNCYLEELKYLKNLFYTSEKIYLKNVEWFLDSDLFSFMLFAPECFRINLEEIYQKLLNCVKFTKEEILEYKIMLVKKANFYAQDTDVGPFRLRKLFVILEKKINEFRAANSNPNTFYRLRKSPNVPSSLALQSTL